MTDNKEFSLPSVQCKNCWNQSILTIKEFLKVEVHNVHTNELFDSDKEIRLSYCPVINCAIDISAVRKCGCFRKED